MQGDVQNYGEHGRELITVEVALRLLQTLADPSAELQVAGRLRSAGRADLQAMLHNTVFKVLLRPHAATLHALYSAPVDVTVAAGRSFGGSTNSSLASVCRQRKGTGPDNRVRQQTTRLAAWPQQA